MSAASKILGSLLAGTLMVGCRAGAPAAAQSPAAPGDGRQSVDELLRRFDTLSAEHGWQPETVYTYPGNEAPPIRAWRTRQRGEALWVLAGIHGEEPAGPNAIAQNLKSISDLAAAGVPMVVIPLCNPKGYRNNWRYPNTAERDWRKGGYSVGDSEYLLPDTGTGSMPRAPRPPGPETQALTGFALSTAVSYPPRLVLDLHEDELSTAGGYI